MKKLILSISLFAIFAGASMSIADDFDNLSGLTPTQKQKLTQIQYNYKQENNSLEMRIIDYNNKMLQLKQDTEKTPAQISLLTSAYERNLSTLKGQQKQLQKDLDTQYKAVLTAEQYKQYSEQQVNVQNSFDNFLQK